MESEIGQEIKIPPDIRPAWERNFSFFVTYLIGEYHMRELKKVLGIGFLMCAFFHSKGQIKFYRSESEEADFNRNLAEKSRKESGFVEYISKNLIDYTTRINDFFLKEKDLTKDNAERLFSLFNSHFPFHFSVFWLADYIEENSLNISDEEKEMLYNARKRDELIFPNIDKWFLKYKPECLLMTPDECMEYIQRGNGLSELEFKKRNEAAFAYFYGNNSNLFSGEKAKLWEEKFNNVFLRRFDLNQKEIRGKAAFSGVYKGIVRVVTRFDDFRNLKTGEVLVTPITIPAYYQYIKKAGAIITDEGAILCHAAILAREQKIPCIVGARIATKVLKDGDLVEVDANKGTVRIIKKAK